MMASNHPPHSWATDSSPMIQSSRSPVGLAISIFQKPMHHFFYRFSSRKNPMALGIDMHQTRPQVVVSNNKEKNQRLKNKRKCFIHIPRSCNISNNCMLSKKYFLQRQDASLSSSSSNMSWHFETGNNWGIQVCSFNLPAWYLREKSGDHDLHRHMESGWKYFQQKLVRLVLRGKVPS